MTKTISIFLIALFCCFKVCGQTYSSLVSDKEIYDFLSWMTTNDKKHSEEPQLKHKQISYKINTWDTANFIFKDTALLSKCPLCEDDLLYLFQKRKGIDTIFKQEDRKFLFQQFTAIKDTVWHKSFANSKLLMNKNQPRPNRYYYSVPLFSLDRKYVVIHREYYCGSLCAYGGYYIYKKVGENKWEYLTQVNSWMS